MIAGRLNEIIFLYQPHEEVTDYGERVTNYVKFFATKAKVEHNSGTRTNENDEIVFPYNYTFYVRSYVPVEETTQIEFQGKKYRILSIDHRREYNDIVINAEVINE